MTGVNTGTASQADPAGGSGSSTTVPPRAFFRAQPRLEEPPFIPWAVTRVKTGDGATLCVRVTGDGPAVLLATGIGVSTPGLEYIAGHLRHHHRVVCWDYRGVGGSRNGNAVTDYSIPRHARDALHILDRLQIPSFALLGWSMGVPVGLEVIRLAPERVRAFGALFGCAGHPFLGRFPWPVAPVLQATLRTWSRYPRLPGLLLQSADRFPSLTWAACTAVHFVGRRARPEIFLADVRSTMQSESEAYFTTMRKLFEHDARDMLPAVRCPALVVAGGRDWVTPAGAAKQMAREMPRARFVVLPDATHFGVIEHGPPLWEPIDELLARAGMVKSRNRSPDTESNPD